MRVEGKGEEMERGKGVRKRGIGDMGKGAYATHDVLVGGKMSLAAAAAEDAFGV